MSLIQEGAKIHSTAVIGKNTFIGSDVSIGKNVKIGQNCHIEGLTDIGDNCQISPLTSIGTPPQDLKYAGEKTRLIIGENTRIREFTQINTGTKGGGGVTKIGSNCLIMGHCHIGHDVQIGDDAVLANFCALAGHVEIGQKVVIGGMSAVHQFCHIGDFTMIGGGSALAKDAPPFCLLEGNRAFIRGLNLIGIRRNLGSVAVDVLKPVFKQLFRNQDSPLLVAKEILKTNDNKLVTLLCEFILSSNRGVAFKPTLRNDNETQDL